MGGGDAVCESEPAGVGGLEGVGIDWGHWSSSTHVERNLRVIETVWSENL